jgi:hypothetical protein
MTAPVASGGSEFAGWGLHPLESAAFARRTPIAVVLRQGTFVEVQSGANLPQN